MKIYIDKSVEYQTFEGFGASGAWWAQAVGGWACMAEISKLLYNKEYGIGLRTYRYNIGAGSADSGAGDIPNPLRRAQSFYNDKGEYDFTKDKHAVSVMKQAVSDGADEVILFVNSPPEALTKNHKAHLDKSKAYRTNLSKTNYAAFVKYCLDVTEHFVNEGLPIKYLSPINEPIWKWTGGQEGCHYSPKQAGRLMRLFAIELEKREALKGVKLSGVESADIRWFNKSYTRELLKYPETRRNIDGVDIHSYFLPAPLPFFNNRTAFLRRFRRYMDKHYPDIPVKMSEWTHMQNGRDRSMSSALVMANVIFEDISILNVTSWQHWIAVSEVDYCDGLIYINLEDKTFEMTKRYYATGNFSKYIPYGAKRVNVISDDNDLKLLAFIKDDKTILIVINDTEKEKEITLPNGGVQIVTDDSDDLKEYESGKDARITPRSVNTFLL